MGSEQPFAALGVDVCCAGPSGLLHLQLLLTQHPPVRAAVLLLRRSLDHRCGHCTPVSWAQSKPIFRCIMPGCDSRGRGGPCSHPFDSLVSVTLLPFGDGACKLRPRYTRAPDPGGNLEKSDARKPPCWDKRRPGAEVAYVNTAEHTIPLDKHGTPPLRSGPENIRMQSVAAHCYPAWRNAN
ncbi:hypothetical protein RUA4292_03048 [Ruegeria atlantica]|uniref:Uncharacterized protein n=1 Tax=Ruegeria atlantica TaxID=81569 RepID=A0A0P1EFI1_9RHOB|nr:hypothetical protein RUA4292_03048 [Ruegeria atlantica]